MKKYKVLKSTYNPTQSTEAMIGKEYECRAELYYDNTISLRNGVYVYIFNKSDLAEVTPIQFKGKSICIGDEVEWDDTWYKVTDYFKYDGVYRLVVENKEQGTHLINKIEITDHKTQGQTETIKIGEHTYDNAEWSFISGKHICIRDQINYWQKEMSIINDN